MSEAEKLSQLPEVQNVVQTWKQKGSNPKNMSFIVVIYSNNNDIQSDNIVYL